MLNVFSIPAFKDNYIWVITQQDQAVVVDPGDAEPVIATLAANNLSLAAIAVTHHHADHQGGVGKLLEVYGDIPVYAPRDEPIAHRTHALVGGESLDFWPHLATPPAHAAPLIALQETATAEAATEATLFKVLSLPGHTRAHIAYYTPGALFCGDVLFGAGCGRLFEGTPAQLWQSLASIAALPAETLVYCAHEYTELNLPFACHVEPNNRQLQQRRIDTKVARANGLPTVPSSLAVELATNPFLRIAEPEIIRSVQDYLAAKTQPDPIQVMAALRSWRDKF